MQTEARHLGQPGVQRVLHRVEGRRERQDEGRCSARKPRQGREQRRRFLTPGAGYQPGNARMYGNGN